MFYQTVVASTLFYAVLRWWNSIKKKDVSCLGKLVRKPGSAASMELDSLICDRATGAEQAPVNHGKSTASTAQHHLRTEEQLEEIVPPPRRATL